MSNPPGKNFYDIPLGELFELEPGARVLLDCGYPATVIEHLRRSGQLRVTTVGDPNRNLLVAYDAIEELRGA